MGQLYIFSTIVYVTSGFSLFFLAACLHASIVWFFSVSSCYQLIICSWGRTRRALACAPPCFSAWEDTLVLQTGFDYCLFSLLPSQLQLSPPLRVAQDTVILSVVLYVNGGGRRQMQGKKCLPSWFPIGSTCPPPPSALTFLPHNETEGPSSFLRRPPLSSTLCSAISCFCGVLRAEFKGAVCIQQMLI